MKQDPTLPDVLARAFMAGEQTAEAAATRAARALGREWKWLPPLASRYIEAFAKGTRPRHGDVAGFVESDTRFRQACGPVRIKIERRLTDPQLMRPVKAAESWNVPVITNAGDLAERFSLGPTELEWFADLGGYQSRLADSKLAHYRYRILPKPRSLRLIEAPKLRMKALQRRILDDILDRVPVHPAAHGFAKGRSIRTFAAPHAAQRVVLRIDLRDFFPSIGRIRIQALFRTIGYPEHVADLLGGVCTHVTPRSVWRDAKADPALVHEAKALYAQPHLPQGAPTSPALANLCAYHADCRLAGLAEATGAVYTRYADDIAFSGGAVNRDPLRFAASAAAILDEEGFAVNHRKTRIMRESGRQRLAGVTINEHPNLAREDFDELKAILTNCVRQGPAAQNRESRPDFRAHLQGRVAFAEMLNPARGARLRALFGAIDWEP